MCGFRQIERRIRRRVYGTAPHQHQLVVNGSPPPGCSVATMHLLPTPSLPCHAVGFTGAVCKYGNQCASGICVRLRPPGTNQTSSRSTAINSFCGCRGSAQCGRLHYCDSNNMCVVKRYRGAACFVAEQCLSGEAWEGGPAWFATLTVATG